VSPNPLANNVIRSDLTLELSRSWRNFIASTVDGR